MKKLLFIFLIFLIIPNILYAKLELIAASPEKGFNFPYYLKTDKKTVNAKYLVVESNNWNSENIKALTKQAKKKHMKCRGYYLATRHNMPFLMPIFPRGKRGLKGYPFIHQLDSDTIKLLKGDRERIDLQLIAMIDDARERLEKKGQMIDEKIIIIGFSSSSLFAARFTFLHPERIKLAVAGGIGGLLPLPILDPRTPVVLSPPCELTWEIKARSKDFDLPSPFRSPEL